MSNRESKASSKTGKWIVLAAFLIFSNPILLIPLIFFGGIWLAIRAVKKQQGSAASSGVSRTVTRSPRQVPFDDCPRGFFCFHRDKGEHHVRRGKEIDPWDRPDIDISKYQRNR